MRRSFIHFLMCAMQHVLITIFFVFALASCSLFGPNDTIFYMAPNVLVSAEARNVDTEEIVSLVSGDNILNVQTTISITINGKEEIIHVDNSTKVLCCKAGDAINIDYNIYCQDQSEELKFDMLETKVFGFDWELEYDLTTFSVDFIVPELPSGKYPITSETMYKINPTSLSAGAQTITPITGAFILIIQ